MSQKSYINHQIRAKSVLVIFDKQNLGVMPIRQALNLSIENGMDLIEVSGSASGNPPVCIIADRGKWQYENNKKQRQNKHKHLDQKEIRLTPLTGDHDIKVKVKQLIGFLEEGREVKITVKFKGRLLAHKEEGKKIIQKIIASLPIVGYKVDRWSRPDDRDVYVFVRPDEDKK